jgi:hypothetical protein
MSTSNQSTPHILGISCVRNEADIIEWMVRYNLKFVDELHVIDNLSKDSTPEILKSLQAEGLPLHLHTCEEPNHPQDRVASRLATRLAGTGRGDFFVPLDADELIDAVSKEAFQAEVLKIPSGRAGSVFWKTFYPESTLPSDGAYFRQMTRFRSHEHRFTNKLILSAQACGAYRWSAGCHNAFHHEAGTPIYRIDLAFHLAHYPVRNAEQLAKKIIVGAHALGLKINRFEGEGSHWFAFHAQLQNSNYELSALDIQKAAQIYSIGESPSPQWKCIVGQYPEGRDSQPFILSGAIQDFEDLKQCYPVRSLSLTQVLAQCLQTATQLAQSQQSLGAGFTQDWFSHNIPDWNYWMTGLKDIENARFLEIGSFEGRSTVWLLQNALLRPDARIYCVDTFQGGMKHSHAHTHNLLQRFRANVAPWKEKVIECIGRSATVVPRIQERFHAIYIDGSHLALDCLRDAVNAWDLLLPNGVMVFDDYGWREYEDPTLLPRTAIDGFLPCISNQYRLLHKGYQVAIQKL